MHCCTNLNPKPKPKPNPNPNPNPNQAAAAAGPDESDEPDGPDYLGVPYEERYAEGTGYSP